MSLLPGSGKGRNRWRRATKKPGYEPPGTASAPSQEAIAEELRATAAQDTRSGTAPGAECARSEVRSDRRTGLICASRSPTRVDRQATQRNGDKPGRRGAI